MDTPSHPRLLAAPKGSFFLFGPRGSGKSTWIRNAFPRAHRVDLLDEALYQSYLADIGAFAAELRGLPPGSVVVVDEVQRLPALLNEVHRHIEDRRLRFVFCGSSARKLKTAGTNRLAGRAVRRHLHPFLPEELGEHFDLDEALRYGTLPVIWTAPDRGEALTAYAQLYLKEEIQAEALVRNLPGFARFLRRGRPVSRRGDQRLRDLPRRRRGSDHGGRLPRDTRGHAPGLSPAGLRSQAPSP